MSTAVLSDRPTTYGRRQNPMLTPEFHRGRKPANAGHRYPPEVYTHEEMQAVIRACGRGLTAYRNRAMIAVMWRSGLRIAECIALRPVDVDFDLGAIRVMHGKGDKDRLVHLDGQTAALIELWLRQRARLNPPRNAPLFCTIEKGIVGRPVRPSYFRDSLKRAGRRAGVEKRMHPHGLRHTFAFNLRREGKDIVTISEALGHTDLGTTQRYLKHLAPLDRILELQQRAWPFELAMLAASAERPLAAGTRSS